MSTAVYVALGVGVVGVGGYLLWKRGQTTNTGATVRGTPVTGADTLPSAPAAQPVNYTPPGGGPSLQDSIASGVGGVGGLAVGSYFAGPVGGIVGAKVGSVVAPLATRAGIADVKSQVGTQIAAVRGVASGVSQIARGNVVSGTKAIAVSGLKSAAAPVTAGISAIRSLF